MEGKQEISNYVGLLSTFCMQAPSLQMEWGHCTERGVQTQSPAWVRTGQRRKPGEEQLATELSETGPVASAARPRQAVLGLCIRLEV